MLQIGHRFTAQDVDYYTVMVHLLWSTCHGPPVYFEPAYDKTSCHKRDAECIRFIINVPFDAEFSIIRSDPMSVHKMGIGQKSS